MSFQGNTSVIWQASPLLQPKMISQRCIDGRLGFCLPPLDAVFPCKTVQWHTVQQSFLPIFDQSHPALKGSQLSIRVHLWNVFKIEETKAGLDIGRPYLKVFYRRRKSRYTAFSDMRTKRNKCKWYLWYFKKRTSSHISKNSVTSTVLRSPLWLADVSASAWPYCLATA